MADADAIPYQFVDFADTVRGYVTDVKKLADTRRAQVKERNTEIGEGVYQALRDPKSVRVAPPTEELPPYFNFAPLDQASDDLTAAAAAYDKAFTAHATTAAAALNPQIMQAERVLLDADGLPKRPWFKDMMYAPGFYTGYGVKTLPAVREAIEQKQWKDVDAQIARTAAAVEREASLLKQATKTLEAGQ
jgi:N-acetylated-alpha-linked acidic dipeptidase